jgi:S1-C subfamily serine protease
MRRGAVIALVLAAALLGGLLSALLVGVVGVGGKSTETIVVPGDAPVPIQRRLETTSAKPLLGNGFDPAAIYRSRSGGVVTVYSFFDGRPQDEHAAQGSGFVVSKEGEILTSAHVVTTAGQSERDPDGASRVFVAFADGDRVPARLVGWDVYDDVAVLRVDPKAHPLAPVPLGDSASVVVGEPVAAVGSPFGNETSLAVGVVSATQRSIGSLTSDYTVPDAIQTDAPITHGNSGGPLFDARGRVIGINAQIRSQSGQAEGVGFAIPINAARRSLEQLVRSGRVAYAYVGVNAEDLTPSIARRLDYSVERGAVVACVVPQSPGERAGLRGGKERRRLNGVEFRHGGDIVVAIGNRPVDDADDLVRVVSEALVPGQVAQFALVRDGRRLTVPVRMGERPTRPAPQC